MVKGHGRTTRLHFGVLFFSAAAALDPLRPAGVALRLARPALGSLPSGRLLLPLHAEHPDGAPERRHPWGKGGAGLGGLV